MPTARLRALRLEAEESPSVSTYRALVREELSYLASRQSQSQSHDSARPPPPPSPSPLSPPPQPQPPSREDPSGRKEELLSLIKTLKRRQHAAASDMRAADGTPGLAKPRRAGGDPHDGKEGRSGGEGGEGGEGGGGGYALHAAECAKYRAVWLALLREFTQRKGVLARVLSYPATAFAHAELGVVAHWLDTWGGFFTTAEQLCRELKGVERGVALPRALPPTRELYALLDDVCRLQLQARSLVGRERYRRSAASDAAVADFLADHTRLIGWCAEQQAALDTLDGVDSLREFCDRLQHNTPVMASNFVVLAEQAEVLAREARVQAGLRRANGAWAGLCYRAFAGLRGAARAEHHRSAIEESCRKWMSEVGPRVREVLLAVNRFLREKGGDPATAALAERGEELLLDHDAHHVICAHLSDYDVREDCVQPHLDALKTELESELTAMVLSFSHVVDYEERDIYKNRIEELKEWIEVNSQKETYLKLLERLEGTKEMIAEYADALFPDDNDRS